jgi:tyrosinase
MVAINFDQNLASLGQRLYILFSNYGNYSTFSNNAWIPLINEASYDSLESLHDTVHNLAGGGGVGQSNPQGGHMSFIPYSAFDPIFFLHHCMVDRIFAIWQALYPNTWVVPQEAALPSYTTSRGQIQDSATALTPFYASGDGTFWTSDTIRDHTLFGYTYAELVSSSAAGPNMTANTEAGIKRAINRLYGASSPASLFVKESKSRVLEHSPRRRMSKQWAKEQAKPAAKPGSLSASESAQNGSSIEPPSGAIFVGDRYREWIANIRVKKQALNGPFSIHFFLGNAPEDSRTWASASNHAGTMGVFASDGRGGMDMTHLYVSGTVPLSTCLVNKVFSGELLSLEPRDVEPYLRQNLQKRIVGADGKVIDASTIEGLGIRIVSSLVRAPLTEDELPSWGRVTAHFDLN